MKTKVISIRLDEELVNKINNSPILKKTVLIFDKFNQILKTIIDRYL